MGDKLKIISDIVGKESLERALEVLKVFEIELPEDFEIYDTERECIYKPSNAKSKPIKRGRIYFPADPDYKKDTHIGFDKNNIAVTCRKKGRRYVWRERAYDGMIADTLDIDGGALDVVFYRTHKATSTSCLYLYADNWSSPEFNSDIFNVNVGNGSWPIDEYFNVFSYFMRNKDNRDYQISKKPEIINTIIKIYKGPIEKLVYELKNTDLSWRFEAEESDIFDSYYAKIEKEGKAYEEKLRRVSDEYRNNLKEADKEKNKSLDDLHKLLKSYDKGKGRIKR